MSISPLKGSPLAINELGSHRATRYSTRPTNQQSPKCTITLERVIGNTISGPNGFDSLRNGTFAICSGSTVVVSQILADETLKQQVYRAPIRSISEIIPGIESLQNSPSRTRGRQVPRPSILSIGNAILDNKDSPGKAAVYKKPKGTSCLALSPNGLFLAVGETGYAPRILLYSLNSGVDTPVSITAEHVSGVQTLCFSPDSRWLCSVGDIYDGSVYIWSISPKGTLKLQISSRCTSTIQDTRWINDKSIITAGVRHLKIWRPDLPSQSTSPTKSTLQGATRTRQESPALSSPGCVSLPGRNVLLGHLLESTFTAVCSIGESRALVGSESGDIGMVNIERGTQKLELVTNLEAPIRCISFDTKTATIFAATSDSRLWICKTSDLLVVGVKSGLINHFKDLTMSLPPLALGIMEDRLLWIDERRCLSIYHTTSSFHGHYSKCKGNYPAHSVAVNGSMVLKNGPNKSLVSYDACGYLISWDSELSPSSDPDVQIGIRSSGPEHELNELKVMKQSREDGLRIYGDKYGNLGYVLSSIPIQRSKKPRRNPFITAEMLTASQLIRLKLASM